MVVKNEAHRWIGGMLEWTKRFVDGIAVLDDESDDITVQICKEIGVRVASRNSAVPSFMQDESQMREAALRYLEFAFEPKVGDWILSLDADEFLVATGSEREALQYNIDRAWDRDGLIFPVAESFGTQKETPLIRTDGYWNQITALRMYRWKPAGKFKAQQLGGGSVPTYVQHPIYAEDIDLLHMGYATPEDRKEKHDRYAAKAGHNPRHVASILHPPVMIRWGGKVPWKEDA
jgi:hypothetical protein